MRLPLFLPPRPGELLYSALARHSQARGSIGPKAVMAELFGRANGIATVDLPNNLASLAARLPRQLGLDARGLIYRHTLLPYYVRFQPRGVRDRAVHAMLGMAGSVHLMLGLPTFRTGRPSHLRFCPECLDGMAERWGSWHWARAHQLPGVLVCAEHGARLRNSKVCLAAINRHEFRPADQDSCPTGCEAVTGSLKGQARYLAIEVARASAALLEEDACVAERGEITADYRRSLARIGLVRGRFKIDQESLSKRFVDHFSPLIDRLEGVALEAVSESWLASLVRSGSGAQPPLQHVLFSLFVASQPDAPTRAVRAYVPRRRVPGFSKRRSVPPSPRVDWRAVDLGYAAAIRRAAEDLRRQVPLKRISVAAVEARLGRRNWLAKRVRKLPLSKRAADEVVESVSAFQTRRLRWHVWACLGEGVDDPWVVLRRAGLPGRLIAAVRAELAERASSQSVEAA